MSNSLGLVVCTNVKDKEPKVQTVEQENRFVIQRWDQEWLEGPELHSGRSSPSIKSTTEIETVFTEGPNDGNPWARFGSPHVSFLQSLSDYSKPVLFTNSRYCFSDGSVSIVVWNLEYRLHLSLLKLHSSYFKGWKAGLSPHFLDDDISVHDWELVLSHVYPNVKPFDESRRSISGWYDLFKTANRLDFHELVTLARERILSLCRGDGINMILAGRNLQLEESLFEGYDILCKRPAPLGFREAGLLFPKELWMVTRLRELYIKGEIDEVNESVVLTLREEEEEEVEEGEGELEEEQEERGLLF